MNKKFLRKMVRVYFNDNNIILGIYYFVFIMMLFITTLMGNEGVNISTIYLVIGFILMLLVIYWKVIYITILAYIDIHKNRFNKLNVSFKTLKEDKSWLLWNSNPKNSAVCKYIATDENNKVYRLCTVCNYQNLKAVEKFLTDKHFRIVQLEKSKLIICIQYNPADFKDKKESQEVNKTTKSLFGPLSYSFTLKEND